MRGTSVASSPRPTIRMTTQVTPAASHPPDPAAPFAWERAPWGWVLTCAPLARLGRHGFTARDLDPGRGAGPDGAWASIAAWLDVPVASLWRLDQVHGCWALRVDASALPAGEALPSADAAITTRTDVAVAVKAADCVPILLAHPDGAVAAVHAGWRGTAQGIAGRTVTDLAAAAGGSTRDILAAIGPSIGPCCYEVGPRSARRSTSRGSPRAISTAGSCRPNRRARRTSSTCGDRTAISWSRPASIRPTSTWRDSARRRTATGSGRTGAKARTPAGCWRSSDARDRADPGYHVVAGVLTPAELAPIAASLDGLLPRAAGPARARSCRCRGFARWLGIGG